MQKTRRDSYKARIPRGQLALLFVRALALGICVPLSSLLLLEKGCTVSTLPLVMGAFSGAVVLLELPSGVVADTFGRRRTFLLSLLLNLLHIAVFLVGDGLALMVATMLLRGAATAFSSGSVEALILEQTVARQGKEVLPSVSYQLSVLETGGIAAGTLLGGAVPLVFGAYQPVMWLAAVLVLVQALLCTLFVREERPSGAAPSMLQCVREGARFVSRDRTVLSVLVATLGAGIFLFAFESFWQPMLLETQSGGDWALGPFSFGLYGIAMVGGFIAARLLTRRERWPAAFLITRLLMAAALVFASFQSHIAGFSGGALLCYLLLGGSNIAEVSLLNESTPDTLRASVLSVNSLCCRLGGLVFSLLSAALVSGIGMRGVWVTAACLLALCMALSAAVRKAPSIVAVGAEK